MNVQTDTPPYLYRYRSLYGKAKDGVQESILNSNYFFASPDSFNDPFDCRPNFSLAATTSELIEYFNGVIARQAPHLNRADRRAEARRRATSPECDPRKPENMTDFYKYYHDSITSKIGILCLSEVCDDILMWSHYANSHRGLCLKFSTSGNVFNTSQPVRYKQKRPIINPIFQNPDEILDHAIFTKSKHWDYEKEWRLLQYKKGAGKYHISSEALVGIILGAEISLEDRQLVMKWVNSFQNTINIYQASLSKSDFAVEINS